MSYSTPELVDFILNATRENPYPLTNDEKDAVQKIIDRHVDPIIDTKLSNRYTVPFKDYPNTPKIITDISAKISTFYFIQFPGGGTDQFEFVQPLKDEAMEMLCALADGDFTISDLEDEIVNGFEFNELKSAAFYGQNVFVGNLTPPFFGDSSKTIS